MSWRRVRIPASSANLGPGFDSLGIALGLYLEVRYRRAERLQINVTGLDCPAISTQSDNLIWQIAQRVGANEPVELEINNQIPIGKGLGSSAAAVIAGVVVGGVERSRLLDECAQIEGHPDNVAPSILGGLVSAASDCTGIPYAIKHRLHPNIGVAVIVPDFVVPTEEARRALPLSYSREDAIFNVQRSALLISALTTGTIDAFPTALDDRLHQPYRFSLVPGLEEMTQMRIQGLLGCALSGAGPSVLVFFERGFEQVCDAVRTIFARHGHAAEILFPGVAEQGIIIHSDE
jgi:homoserine kinase